MPKLLNRVVVLLLVPAIIMGCNPIPLNPADRVTSRRPLQFNGPFTSQALADVSMEAEVPLGSQLEKILLEKETSSFLIGAPAKNNDRQWTTVGDVIFLTTVFFLFPWVQEYVRHIALQHFGRPVLTAIIFLALLAPGMAVDIYNLGKWDGHPHSRPEKSLREILQLSAMFAIPSILGTIIIQLSYYFGAGGHWHVAAGIHVVYNVLIAVFFGLIFPDIFRAPYLLIGRPLLDTAFHWQAPTPQMTSAQPPENEFISELKNTASAYVPSDLPAASDTSWRACLIGVLNQFHHPKIKGPLRRRNQAIIAALETFSGIRVVDLCTGDGAFLKAYQIIHSNEKIIGFDPYGQKIDQASSDIVIQDGGENGLSDESVDKVFINMPFPEKIGLVMPYLFKEAQRILKPGGQLFVTFEKTGPANPNTPYIEALEIDIPAMAEQAGFVSHANVVDLSSLPQFPRSSYMKIFEEIEGVRLYSYLKPAAQTQTVKTILSTLALGLMASIATSGQETVFQPLGALHFILASVIGAVAMVSTILITQRWPEGDAGYVAILAGLISSGSGGFTASRILRFVARRAA